MASIKTAYQFVAPLVGTLAVTGLSTLASGATVTSAANSDAAVSLYLDAFVNVSIQAATTGVSASTGFASIYLESSLDATNYPDSTGANDLIGATMVMTINSSTYLTTFNLAKVFSGVIPPYWRLRFVNNTGAAFRAATVTFNHIYMTSV